MGPLKGVLNTITPGAIFAGPAVIAAVSLQQARYMPNETFSNAYKATALRNGFVVDMYQNGGRK